MDRNKYEKYQSDIIVDLLKQYDIKHISMNPGASFRGLHDSIINYGENDPELMVCQHEEIAVQIAHGYARATGKPMGVILHNLVGMLHAQMAVYYAYIDRAPIFIMGATGPMHEGKRRPHIDWSHSALRAFHFSFSSTAPLEALSISARSCSNCFSNPRERFCSSWREPSTDDTFSFAAVISRSDSSARVSS